MASPGIELGYKASFLRPVLCSTNKNAPQRTKTLRIELKMPRRDCEASYLWCHQEMSFISKWLYIFALKNRNKRNLPLLLHLISAPFCSVSQSRVPTLLQRYIIIVIYKWELQSYFFIISSIRHFTASSKPFLIPCDNP